ncbi:MAG: cellulose biosynthesis protein BcsS [Bradyrhizobiaceae bacterium]|nr:MAG: cellulose biosynthesis protein BcsS [Bradyrhizobiaceae bacterium]
MRCVRVMRAICVAASGLACAAGAALADPVTDADNWSTGASGAAAEKFLYFSGFDLWRSGGTAYGGMMWSPGGLNADGFTLKLLLAGGSYLYRSGINDIRGTYLLGSVMPGWRIKRGDVEIKLFAGLDLQHHETSPDDPGNRLRGDHAGIRLNAEVWWEPIPAQMMVAASFSGSTVGDNFGVRAATGWRMLDKFWAGPEAEASGDLVYRQYRVGAHLTSFKTGDFEWTLGAGYVEDNSDRSGLYARIGLLTRQ